MSEFDNSTFRRNAQSTRERIIRAAAAHFARKPLSSVPLKEIATDAGVSAPLIIKYFGSKEGLLTELIDFSHFEGKIGQAPFEELGTIMASTILLGQGLQGQSLVPLIVASLDSKSISAVVAQRFDEAVAADLIERIHKDAPGEVSRTVARHRAQMAVSLCVGYIVLSASNLINNDEGETLSVEMLANSLQHIIEHS
nr:TetR/AcrR family transcriptional regulator [Corynebacterium lactis]